jgi:eukaryotic-like serine/threonine-protein kinase
MKTLCFIALFISIGQYLLAGNLKENWVFKTNGRVYSTPAVSLDAVLFGSADSNFYSVDKNTGNLNWSFRTNGGIHSDPAISDSDVLFGSYDGCLYSLDAASGKFNWKFASEGEKTLDIWDYYLSSPKVSQGIVYWGSGDGHLYAVDCVSGKLKWKFKAGAIIHASPAIDEGIVFIGDFSGYFYALDALSGELKWKSRTIGETYFPNGEVQKAAVVFDGVVYFGSRDYNVYALDAKTGRGRWNMKETGSWVVATPTVYEKHVYFGTSDTHRFYSLRKADGKVIWQIALPMRVYGSAVVNNDILWFGCFDGMLRGVNPKTGEIIHEFQTESSKLNYSTVFGDDGKFREGFELYGKDYLEAERTIHSLGSILSTPVIDENIIYFGSSDGGLYAVSL